jgi:hypothetical protein
LNRGDVSILPSPADLACIEFAQRHCERSEAIQGGDSALDRFVAIAPRDDEGVMISERGRL